MIAARSRLQGAYRGSGTSCWSHLRQGQSVPVEVLERPLQGLLRRACGGKVQRGGDLLYCRPQITRTIYPIAETGTWPPKRLYHWE